MVEPRAETPRDQIIGYSEMLVGQSQEAGNSSFTPDLEKIRSAGKRTLTFLDQNSTCSGGPDGRGQRGCFVQGLHDSHERPFNHSMHDHARSPMVGMTQKLRRHELRQAWVAGTSNRTGVDANGQ